MDKLCLNVLLLWQHKKIKKNKSEKINISSIFVWWYLYYIFYRFRYYFLFLLHEYLNIRIYLILYIALFNYSNIRDLPLISIYEICHFAVNNRFRLKRRERAFLRTWLEHDEFGKVHERDRELLNLSRIRSLLTFAFKIAQWPVQEFAPFHLSSFHPRSLSRTNDGHRQQPPLPSL